MNCKIKRITSILIALFLAISITGCSSTDISNNSSKNISSVSIEDIPAFQDEAYVEINDNIPEFTEEEKNSTDSFEEYMPLDDLGRCGTAFANVSIDTMPTEDREGIGMIKPSGWHTARYDDLISDRYLYNRCHLIGFQLTGENANELNLITGTRYMNVEGMLPFENMVADYVRDTENHVLYRVTPIFEGDNLVASGVQMEAYSVEDKGEGISFNVYCYNNQSGIEIDYKTGESKRIGEKENKKEENRTVTYVINTNTGKFHVPSCSSVYDIKAQNKKEFTGTKAEVEEKGYEPCGICKP